MNEVLCKKCATWVDCGEREGEPYGFCLQEYLFSYTARENCNNFLEGQPMTEQEYESYNMGEI